MQDDTTTRFIHPNVASFVAGLFGGLGGVISGHPFDTVKVRLQSQTNKKYNGTIHCFSTIVREETVFGLFKGITSPLIGVALANSLLFGVYGSILNAQMTGAVREQPTLWQIFLAGSGSGFVNSPISCCTELAKIQLQNQLGESKYKGTIDCLRRIYFVNGIKGCFTGIASTVCRETPSYGMYFASYEFLCRLFCKPGEKTQDLDSLRLMMAGGLGGIASWLITYPFDVVKTVVQSQDLSQKNGNYRGMIESFRFYYRQEGVGFFFRGINATVIRAFPTNAFTFLAYALSLRLMEPYMALKY